jgi:RNA polymerase sigma-70 factor (ECF subfamily)
MDADSTRSQLAAALVRVAGGDRAALRIVYQDTSAKLFGVVLRILNDRSEAEDVLQEVFVTVWRKAGSFDPGRASPITWLVAIARNRSIDRLRAGGGRRMEPIETAEDVRDTGPALSTWSRPGKSARLATCLGELRSATRPPSGRRSSTGPPTRTAERMRVPLGTMKSWIRRGLLKLRACLEQ